MFYCSAGKKILQSTVTTVDGHFRREQMYTMLNTVKYKVIVK